MCIVTEDGLEHVGLVYTIDPVSESYVLATLGEVTKLELILGHAIRSVTVLSENMEIYKEQLDNLFRSKEQVMNCIAVDKCVRPADEPTNSVIGKACSTTKGGLIAYIYRLPLLASQTTEFLICIVHQCRVADDAAYHLI